MSDKGAGLWRLLLDTGVESPEAATSESVVHAYHEASNRLIAQRAPLAAGVFLFFVGSASLLEWRFFPARRDSLLLAYAIELALCLMHVVQARRRPSFGWPAAAGVYAALTACMGWYLTHVSGNAEMLALALVLFLAGTAVVYPWGAQGQVTVSIAAVVVYVCAVASGVASNLPELYNVFALIASGVVTTLGAHLVGQHRWGAFRHAAELRQANARQRQETEVSNALLSLTDSLSTTLSDPRETAKRLNEHTRQALGFDWTLTSLLDETRQVFRTVAVSGPRREVVDEVETVELARGSLPLHDAIEREELIEIADRDHQTLVPPRLLEHWGARSLLASVIARGGRMIGMLVGGYLERPGPFSITQRRLLKGFAQHAAVALENARLIETVREANRIKSEFVATVSHELRTPLNVILGYVDLLVEHALGELNPEQQDALSRVRARSLHLLDLIQDILDINRLESGRLPLSIDDFSVGEALHTVRNAVPAAWRRPGVELRFDTTHDQLVLRSDRSKIEMVVRNLVHNALKYTERGLVEVSVNPRPSARAVEFVVRDTGAGIPPDELPRIFDMFRQGNGAKRPIEGGGVGLGLYIVRRLIEALGGTVTAESELGRGSQFTVSLPLEPAPTVAVRELPD